MINKAIIAMAVILTATSSVYAAEYTVDQKDKTFMKDDKPVAEIDLKVGDTIRFRNQDPWFHNIFSFSEAKTFDLGSYPKGESKAVVFDKAGTVDVQCAIHSKMRMTVKVK